MEAEDLAFDDSGQWQVIEEFSECLPHIRISILSQTLVVETVHLSDLSGFMVTSENGQSISESDL